MICAYCKNDYALSEFPALIGAPGYDKSKKDRCYKCCRSHMNRLWAIRYATVEGRAKWMLMNAKNRAKQRGIPYTLTLEWAVTRLRAGVCEATGLPFDFSTDRVDLKVGEWAHALAPSVERKDPAGGYTPDNCEIIVWLLNRAKANFDRDVFDQVMRAYIELRRPQACHTSQS